MQALESLGKDPLVIGAIPPTPRIVDQYYNASNGKGDSGEIDARGPWTEGLEYIDAPALQEFQVVKATPKEGRTTLDRATTKGNGK